MLYSLRSFGREEAAKEIKLYEKYGEKATREAFSSNRKVLSRWGKRLKVIAYWL